MYRIIKKIFLFLLLVSGITFFERCARTNDNDKLVPDATCLIKDDNGFIRAKPLRISCEHENNFKFLITPDRIVEYDNNSKLVKVLFDSIRFDVDSLIAATYQVKYKHTYRYYKHKPKELRNVDHNLYVINPFSYYKERYYLPISIKALAENVFDDATNSKDKRLLDSIKNLYGNNKVNSLENLSFVLVADKDFKQLNIIPFYLKSKEGFISKTKGSFFYEGNYYFSIHSNKVKCPSDSFSIKGLEPDFYYKSFTLSDTGISSSKSLIDKKMVNPEQYTWSRHLMQNLSFFVSGKGLIASQGRELINISTQQLYPKQPILEPDEFVSNFLISGKYIIYLTEKYDKQQTGTKQYGYVNNLGSVEISVMDTGDNKIVAQHHLKTDGVYTLTPPNILYEYLEDKNSVLINKYIIHPSL